MARPGTPLLFATLILTTALSSNGQQELAISELPSAPTAEARAVILTRPPAAPRLADHRRPTLNNLSLAVRLARRDGSAESLLPSTSPAPSSTSTAAFRTFSSRATTATPAHGISISPTRQSSIPLPAGGDVTDSNPRT